MPSEEKICLVCRGHSCVQITGLLWPNNLREVPCPECGKKIMPSDNNLDKTMTKPRKMHPNSLANLRPFAKGNRGNPNGRPRKEDCLLDCIKTELSSKSIDGVTTKEQMIAGALVSMAEKGNLKAIEILMSYTTVKPVVRTDVTTGGDKINIVEVVKS